MCLNAARGACGAPYGKPHQSCGSGLLCPVQNEDGSVGQADCCEAIAIPGGTFTMGLQPDGKNRCPADFDVDVICSASGDEYPPHSVTLSTYSLDRFEVTVGRFREFYEEFDYAGLPEGAGGNAQVAGAGWQSQWNSSLPTSKEQLAEDIGCYTTAFQSHNEDATWTDEPGTNEPLPIECVSWYEAFAFCAWDGGRLPTEAEWEYAAANGASTNLYPWGQAQPTPTLAFYGCTGAGLCDVSDPLSPPLPVGSLPRGANVWGHRNLAGNVGEWVLDAWAPYPAQAVTNYANVTAQGIRVSRGGSRAESILWIRAAARDGSDASLVSPLVGLRCARDP
jgi:formylglycine-generating enzyme